MASISLLVQVDWVVIRIVRDVVRVSIVVSQLDELVAAFLFLLFIKYFHIFIDFILFLQGQVCLVLKISSPILLIGGMLGVVLNLSISLDKVVIALAVLWESMGTISLVRGWDVVAVIIVVHDLNHLVIVIVRLLVSVMSLLCIVALEVLMEEAIVVAVRRQLGVM